MPQLEFDVIFATGQVSLNQENDDIMVGAVQSDGTLKIAHTAVLLHV